MEDITHRRVINDHDLTKVRLHLSEILDVCALAIGAVLAVVAADEVFALDFEPVDDGVRVFLDGGGEDDEVVPFADLWSTLISATLQ